MSALADTLAPDARLVSPLVARAVFRGREDLRVLMTNVYGLLGDVQWSQPVGEGSTRVAITQAHVGGMRIDDAMVFELGDDGLIRTIRPHLRPWLATTVFAVLLLPRLARTPGVLLRALARA